MPQHSMLSSIFSLGESSEKSNTTDGSLAPDNFSGDCTVQTNAQCQNKIMQSWGMLPSSRLFGVKWSGYSHSFSRLDVLIKSALFNIIFSVDSCK